MITMLILFIATCLLGFILWGCDKISEGAFAGFCLFAAMMFIVIPSVAQNTVLSYGLTPTKSFIDGQLYKDTETNKYYAIYSDENWKIWDLYEKVEIPENVALQKIASTNKTEKISK